MRHFNPPARIDDFARSPRAAELAKGWNAIIDSWLTSAVNDADGLFYNPRSEDSGSGGEVAPISWDAFPLVIKNWFDGQPNGDRLSLEAADTLKPLRPGGRKLRAVREGRLAEEIDLAFRQQDEYCEWFVERRDGRITGVQLTSEGPEYWGFLVSGTKAFFAPEDPRGNITAGDPDLALALYREHISPEVELSDLVWQHDVAAFNGSGWTSYARRGDYNRLNKWNTTHGAMHLTHPSNALQAEIYLAADATVLRNAPSDAEVLICCAGYGNVNRSSDPLIGLSVNQLAATNHRMTLADPIGIYISEMNIGALSHASAWRVVRGSAADHMILRARIDIPDSSEFRVGGVPLHYGGQIAKHVGMVLTGEIVEHADELPPARDCGYACCINPERSSFKTLVESGGDCARVPWELLEPYLPAREPHPEPVAARHALDWNAVIEPGRSVRPASRAGWW